MQNTDYTLIAKLHANGIDKHEFSVNWKNKSNRRVDREMMPERLVST
jgi:hypothetical protein